MSQGSWGRAGCVWLDKPCCGSLGLDCPGVVGFVGVGSDEAVVESCEMFGFDLLC